MKNHENQPGTMKNHENRPGTMKNQPGAMKTMKIYLEQKKTTLNNEKPTCNRGK